MILVVYDLDNQFSKEASWKPVGAFATIVEQGYVQY